MLDHHTNYSRIKGIELLISNFSSKEKMGVMLYSGLPHEPSMALGKSINFNLFLPVLKQR